MYIVLSAIIVAAAVPVLAVVVVAEPFLITAALLTVDGRTSLGLLLVLTVVSSLVGDVLSYWIGRQFGGRLLNVRGVRRCRGKATKAVRTVRSRGGMMAVVIQRWIPPGRGFVPAIIGATHQSFGRFVGFATLAAVLWGVPLVLAVHYGGTELLVVLPLLLTVVLVRDVYRATRRFRAARRIRQSPEFRQGQSKPAHRLSTGHR
ncbi:DedA family protein [Mycolicibacterium stellerae]|uniref:DedA family protein n=1 Tax=Mycolicibacterium stellerae TaxID=2358193 RepID=UPI0019D18E2E|nr:VTT domain-containing protein [Mycolicibacterium stellerae]